MADASAALVVQFGAWAPHAELGWLCTRALREEPKLRAAGYRIRPRPLHWPDERTDFVILETRAPAAAAEALLRHRPADRAQVRAVSPMRHYSAGPPARRPLAGPPSRGGASVPKDYITTHLNASHWWARGARGSGVRVAIFDTGLPAINSAKIAEAVNFASERTTDDRVGHSAFMTGVIGGSRGACAGLAPDTTVYIARVFDSNQQSTTEWFLAAFNFALSRDVDLINLSVGGPDFRDAPFVEKALLNYFISVTE